ncbi:protein bassoon [Ambystoma mexicanum]|uniref:protein bassoon n=1 Tax=Ambystoma mexicanum TaxID=8296 RepID=UPI0037E8F046
MGNEASLEGGEGGQPPPGTPAATTAAGKPPSAPSHGQLPGPSAVSQQQSSAPGRLDHTERLAGQRSVPHAFKQSTSSNESTKEMKSHVPSSQQADSPRRSLHVDKIQRSGRSPSASPDRGTTPTSPYSVPQIAPMPSSTVCPICNTTDLTSSPNQPNFNRCTQCRNEVCNQCGFNPNPHLTEVKEWLCLNCQMQRALGMDMTTAPRSKSQQQLHSPALSPSHSPAKQPIPRHQSQPQLQYQAQLQPQPQSQLQTKIGHEKSLGTTPNIVHGTNVMSSQQVKPQETKQKEQLSQSQPKPTAPQETIRSSPNHQQAKPSLQHQTRPSPQHQQAMPSPQHPQTMPLPQNQQAKPSPHHQQTMPSPHHQQTMPSPQHQQAMPSPQHQQAMPSPQHQQAKPSSQHQQIKPSPTEQRKHAGESPSKLPTPLSTGTQEQPQEGLTGKLFGFGASLLNQASTLISVQPEATPQSQQSPGKVPPKIVFSDASKETEIKAQGTLSGKQGKAGSSSIPTHTSTEHTVKPKDVPKERVMCPLCKAELNVGSGEPSNYNNCTACTKQVCNMCGFNPTPHLVEKNEWLCLNCQTQRLLDGSLGDAPPSVSVPNPKQQPTGLTSHPSIGTPTGSPRHQPGTTPTGSTQHQPGQTHTGSPRHQSGVTSLQQQHRVLPQPPVTGHQLETSQVRHFSQSENLSASKQNKTHTPVSTHSNLPAAFDENLQSKTLAESPKLSKSLMPKGKSSGTRKDSTIKESKTTPEIHKVKYKEDFSKSYPHDLSRSPQSQSDTGYSSDGISSSQSEITGLVQQDEDQLSGAGLLERSPLSPSELTKLESSVRPLLESKGISREQSGKMFHELREEQRQKQRPLSLSISPEAFDSDESLEDIMEEDEDSIEWEKQKDQRETIESSDDVGSKMRHDFVEDSSEGGFSPLPTKPSKGEFTAEEFMRQQILEMSAEEDNFDDDEEEYDHVKYARTKSNHISDSEKNKDISSSNRRIPHTSSNMYVEDGEGMEGMEDEDMTASQGGLRRFKTIELNSTNSYNRDMELSHQTDLGLEREPELEMESLTGSPEERSRGEYSSTLPATTPSYTSGTSPTSISSLEEDSDSSPSRRQRLEDVKQQRKARHRSHGPLLPTIEDSSEEEELREEEELLREQEKMREVEQQRIRSTARKTKRDKEELRAQRRRERSKTPPSNLSPIEDASPTEELRQAAEMEELHRSSCSEYSPSIDSEAEGFDIIASKLYKSGSEYNLPTFMSLYSPTEKNAGSLSYANKPLKSAEEVYEEMMRKAEMFQKHHVQQSQQQIPYSNTYQQIGYRLEENQNQFEYQYIDEYSYESGQMASKQNDFQNELTKSGTVYEEILQTSQNISRMHQSSSLDLSMQMEDKPNSEKTFQEKQFLNADSAYTDMLKQNSGPLTPGTSPTQLSAPVSFSTSEISSGRNIPDVRVTQHYSNVGHQQPKLQSSPSAPGLGSKVTASCQYSKGSSTATTGTSMNQTFITNVTCAPVLHSSPPSVSGSDVIPAATSRGYVPSKASPDYYSSNEDLHRTKSTSAISTSIQEKSQNISDSKTNASLTSKVISFFKSPSPPLSPTSPTQSPTRSFPRTGRPSSPVSGDKPTAEFSTQTQSAVRTCTTPAASSTLASSPMIAQGTQTPQRSSSAPRLSRHHSSQEGPFMVITLASDASSQTKPVSVGSSTSPATTPTRLSRQPTVQGHQEQLPSSYSRSVIDRAPTSSSVIHSNAVKGHSTCPADISANEYSWGALPPENISLCRISSVPGTSRVEPGPKLQGGSAVDLRTAIKSAPIIITDQGMDLTSLATESRRYSLTSEQSPTRQSTAVQPMIINLNAQEQPHAVISTATTVSITVASSMLVSQPKQPVVYGDPFQNRVDFGQGAGSAVCLTQVRQMEQAGQSGFIRGTVNNGETPIVEEKAEGVSGPQHTMFTRYNLPNQMTALVQKEVLAVQTSHAQNVISISTMPRQMQQDPSVAPSEIYRGYPMEIKSQTSSVNISGKRSHDIMVQLDDVAKGTVTKLIKEEPSANALDLTGIKPESQVACCDVVYKFPFGSSCTGTFTPPPPKIPEINTVDPSQVRRAGVQYYGSKGQEISETYPYKEPSTAAAQTVYDEHKYFPNTVNGRMQPSMSDPNLSEIGINYFPTKNEQPFNGAGGDSAIDLTTMNHSYSTSFADYLGQGLQYGSFTDLRQPTDLLSHSLPIRRYNSLSNIYSDYRYSSRGELSNFQESNLAQYSATTAREISRMCAALNSMDQYGGRHTNNPDLLQYGSNSINAGAVRSGIISAQQSMKSNMIYNPNFSGIRQGFGNLPQYNVTGPRLGAAMQMYPSTATVRAADGMIYSTINTPIASTLPITTQPASVLRPMLRGVYRPYCTGNLTAVPLASLTRVPLVAPRIPLPTQGLYRYPTPSRFPSVSTTSVMEAPMYLGKPPNTFSAGTVSTSECSNTAVPSAPVTTIPKQEQTSSGIWEDSLPGAHGGHSVPKDVSQPSPQAVQKQQLESQTSASTIRNSAEKEEKEKEEDRQRKQQEHILQIERERVELEKLRQMRLHEELERERLELQRHREKEQMLVQREIQELQTIKHQVLQQQQEERQTQFALQREQLAQQRLQLEQIQHLQQQLQQQLEDQKRQKTTLPPACDPSVKVPPQTVSEMAIEMQKTLAQNAPYWSPMAQPFMAMAAQGQDIQTQHRCSAPQRPLTNSASDMSLQTEENWDSNRDIKKRNSMPRLRDAYDMGDSHEPYIVKKITDSSVQTDDEDGEERYYMSRRRRTRRSTDCSVQTDDEDNGEWEQPTRRRRSRFSRHSDSGSESKHDSAKGTSSIAIQTTSDCSVQTEPDQLQRVSPSIHITNPDPRVEIVKYISAPEKTRRGESLACQTEPDSQSQGIAVPPLSVPTSITPYSSNIQIVTSGPLDPNISRQQGVTKFEKKKPDPLEIGYQSHLPTDSLSQLVARQPPKSPQVLYSPVSPLSPHRLLESTFASSERLNKAHVTPQKHFTTDTTQRQQTLPRPIKTMQRSLSDPKPISPTSDESGKDRFSMYQQQLLQNQISALQSNTLTRKVKRTLPSPPPDEAHLPITSQAAPQMYMSSLLQRGVGGQIVQLPKVGLLKSIDRDLRIVEQESTKLRKQQAELDEEEKEIDAKLKYLELGIHQRKESLVKEVGGSRREFSYMRSLGENRDYMSDSELNNLRISTYDTSSLLTRPSTTPLNQFSDFSTTQQYPTTTSYTQSCYQHPTGHAILHSSSTFEHSRLQQTSYPVASTGLSQNGFQNRQIPTYSSPSAYQGHNITQTAGYQSELGLQNHVDLRTPNQYQSQPTYSSQSSSQPPQNSLFPAQADSQKPRQTTLADLEQKIPTNYEVIGNPIVVISSAAPDVTYSNTAVTTSYDQYKPTETRPSDRISAVESPSNTYGSDSLYTNLEQNIPRNYVVIEDISELTKENASTAESQRFDPHMHSQPHLQPQNTNGRHTKEKNGLLENDGSGRTCYSRAEDESEEDAYDHHSSDHRGKNNYHRNSENIGRVSGNSGSSSYYYGDNDYRHSSRPEKHGSNSSIQKHTSKNLAPAVISSKRSKHRKQGMEQKISKFSPIEEAKDVESDLASYPVTTSVGSNSSVTTRGRKLQEEITYGLKKNVYDQQKYYGLSSRDMIEDEDRSYNSASRSRSASNYGSEKSTNRDSINSRSKSYERDSADRFQKPNSKPSSLTMSQNRGRTPVRTQASEEESPVSPLGKSVGMSRSSGGPLPQANTDSCPSFCSSHSLPDVQEHVKEVPRNHSYKQEECYLMDDSNCVVSDSEAYHLGQEETDWFDKPREARSERSRYYSGHPATSQKKTQIKHTYHDYDEPPDEDLWQHDEYSQSRHSSKEQRHHGESGRHYSSSSRHINEEQCRRPSKQHPKEQGRHESRPHSQPSSSQRKTQQPSYSNSDYSQPSRQSSSYHHTSEPQKSQRHTPPPQQQKSETPQQIRQQPGQQQSPRQQQPHQPPSRQQQQQSGSSQSSSHQQVPPQQGPHPQATSTQAPTQQVPSQQIPQQQAVQPAVPQQQQSRQQQQPVALQHPPQGATGQPSTRPQQQQPVQPQQAVKQQSLQPQPGSHQTGPKAEQIDTSKAAVKTLQMGRAPQAQPQATAAGIKVAQKPVGIGTSAGGATTAGAPTIQPGTDGESMLSKILPGGAAEQAGKLTDAVSAFGKKFSSLW